MKKKILNIVEIILQVIIFIIPFFTTCTDGYTSALTYGYNTNNLKTEILSDVINSWPFFNIVYCSFIAINILMCAISIFSKSKKADSKIHCALPIIIFFFTNFIFIAITDINSINNLFVLEVLMFAVIIISFVKRAYFIVSESEQKPDENVKSSDVAKIKEFKALLDCGAITQEEFDEKKKQLLNL